MTASTDPLIAAKDHHEIIVKTMERVRTHATVILHLLKGREVFLLANRAGPYTVSEVRLVNGAIHIYAKTKGRSKCIAISLDHITLEKPQ